jgi:agmatinase
MPPHAMEFLGMKPAGRESEQEAPRYSISLIPFERTTTYKTGTAAAPEAIIEASGQIEFYDEELGLDASRHGIATLRPSVTDLASITSHAAGLRRTHSGAVHGFLGGEHSITPPIIEGLGLKNVGIVWIDAHADLRSEYLGSPWNHACAARNCLEFGKIVQIGVRSLAEEEHEFLQSTDRVMRFREWTQAARDAIMSLPRTIYLSVDMDGLNPELIRAVGTPEPGGLAWKDMLEILDCIGGEKELAAFDVVELCPAPHDVTSEYTTARLVYKIISYHALHAF